MHTLVIIDMQPMFTASKNKKLISNICREIQLSKRNNWPIILVRYSGCGKITSTISKALKNYQNIKCVTKDADNGSKEVIRTLKKVTKSKNLRLVGVNTNACVAQTAAGLSYTYKVTLVNDCCNSDELKTDTEHRKFITSFCKRNDINLIRVNKGIKQFDEVFS